MSNLTRKQKEALAAVLIDQAGNLVEFFSEHTEGNDALAGITADQVARQLSVWLGRLPGDAWDVRLQGYEVPTVKEPEVTDLGPLETISPLQERILRSGSEINGMTTLSLTEGADVRELDSLVRHGYLWADENGRTLLDTRGYAWLVANPAPVESVEVTDDQALALTEIGMDMVGYTVAGNVLKICDSDMNRGMLLELIRRRWVEPLVCNGSLYCARLTAHGRAVLDSYQGPNR